MTLIPICIFYLLYLSLSSWIRQLVASGRQCVNIWELKASSSQIISCSYLLRKYSFLFCHDFTSPQRIPSLSDIWSMGDRHRSTCHTQTSRTRSLKFGPLNHAQLNLKGIHFLYSPLFHCNIMGWWSEIELSITTDSAFPRCSTTYPCIIEWSSLSATHAIFPQPLSHVGTTLCGHQSTKLDSIITSLISSIVGSIFF